MAHDNRHNQIIQYLKDRKTASVDELAKHLYVSEATIRRDLSELQKLGQVERNHGGVILVENADEISFFIRVTKNAKEKELTASIAMKHLPEFQSVFIDNSSTCLALAERINLAHKTVVTNGLQVAMTLSKVKDINLIMPGGEVHFNTNAVTGSMALTTLENFRFDLMLSSCAAIAPDGTYENSLETMQLKKYAFMRSKTAILLVDHTKFKISSIYRTLDLKDYDAIISDCDKATLNMLHNNKATAFNA